MIHYPSCTYTCICSCTVYLDMRELYCMGVHYYNVYENEHFDKEQQLINVYRSKITDIRSL